MSNEVVGIVGFGHLGKALYRGLLTAGYKVLINNGSLERTQQKISEAGINEEAATLSEIARVCSIIFLCIRHDQLGIVGKELSDHLTNSHIIISCLAQADSHEVNSALQSKDTPVAKLMTTLSVQENMGVSAYQLDLHDTATALQVRNVIQAVSAANCALRLDTEEEMRVFTVAVGCFPGIIAYILEQLAASVKQRGGVSFKQYDQLFATLLRATATLIEHAGSTAHLIPIIATEGGVTKEMLGSLAASKIDEIMDQSVQAGLYTMYKLKNKGKHDSNIR